MGGAERAQQDRDRVVFTIDGSTMVLLHGFTKTTKKTRKADIDTALARKAIREKSR